MNTTKIPVTSKDASLTLLDFLARKLDISKKKAKALLDARSVFVNRKRVWMARHKLREGDTVEFTDSTPTAGRQDADILFQDEHYLAVNKQPGIISNGENSLESMLRQELSLPGLLSIHRLDKDTSGCLLLAMNRPAFNLMLALFKKKLVDKTYHTIVSGSVNTPDRTITDEIDGQTAITHIKMLDANRQASHLQVKIRTGRTHQIRKHLASIKHPVLGDRQYGAGIKNNEKTMRIGRQMLHASGLRFDHPVTGKKISIRAPLPKDFRSCLKNFNLT